MKYINKKHCHVVYINVLYIFLILQIHNTLKLAPYICKIQLKKENVKKILFVLIGIFVSESLEI